jgi:Flp pilus assembly protein TadG
MNHKTWPGPFSPKNKENRKILKLITRQLRRILPDNTGISAVEFAMIFPIRLLITAGVVDFGKIFYVRSMVQETIDQESRNAAVRRVGNTELNNLIEEKITSLGSINNANSETNIEFDHMETSGNLSRGRIL